MTNLEISEQVVQFHQRRERVAATYRLGLARVQPDDLEVLLENRRNIEGSITWACSSGEWRLAVDLIHALMVLFDRHGPGIPGHLEMQATEDILGIMDGRKCCP
jgi:hypothetical protein